MALFIFSLILLATYGITLTVTRIMDDVLLQSLLRRGNVIAQTASGPAGFSILNQDRLALDNLAAQIMASQPDMAYLAILDYQQNILAQGNLETAVGRFNFLAGDPIATTDNTSIVSLVHNGIGCYEFRRPILFANQTVGYVVIGIDTNDLTVAREQARGQVLKIVLLLLIVTLIGVFALVSLLTQPIKRLAGGMEQVCHGEERIQLPVTSTDELGLLTRRFNFMAEQIERQRQGLKLSAADLEASYNDIVRILAATLDARDNYTFGHSTRVAHIALGIGRQIGLEATALHELEMACLLHDIGKIKIPDAILNKSEGLDPQEYRQIMAHPEHGSEILSLSASLHKYIPAVRHHHERYDGKGYPDGLQGDHIPLNAQIVALADTYDAMTSSRPYRAGRDDSAAAAEIRACSGSQFNPHLVDIFLDIRPYLLVTADKDFDWGPQS
jgi:HD-GYP domain-containing protein (c-di-GMP phosphodiesterase class II)